MDREPRLNQGWSAAILVPLPPKKNSIDFWAAFCPRARKVGNVIVQGKGTHATAVRVRRTKKNTGFVTGMSATV